MFNVSITEVNLNLFSHKLIRFNFERLFSKSLQLHGSKTKIENQNVLLKGCSK
jgi:hypothetical protein